MRFKKRDGLVSTIFSVITCGIYGIYFWYCYGEDVNELCAEDGKHTPNYIVAWLLSLITCGIYGIYWTYNLASRLDTAQSKYQVNVESPVFFTLFMNIPVLGYLYACDIMNKFGDAYIRMYPGGNGGNGGYGYNQPGPGPVPPYGGEDLHQSTVPPFGEDLKSAFMDVGRSVKQSVSDAMHSVSQDQEPVRTCRNCGAVIPPEKQYCGRCGYPADGLQPQNMAQSGRKSEAPDQTAGQQEGVQNAGQEQHGENQHKMPDAGWIDSSQEATERTSPDLCPNCGSVIQKGDKFCIHCGHRL